MYKVMSKKEDGEIEVSRSRNYRIVKRKARDKASTDPHVWFDTFILYENDKAIERGNIISKRVSWEKV